MQKYNQYISSFSGKQWNLRNELIKYCEQDVVSLYEVWCKFDKYIFDKFQIKINHSKTLPSLAFKIFNKKFLNSDQIPIITGNIYKDIVQSYRGGLVDVYRPSSINK
jgi:hypothetical protein